MQIMVAEVDHCPRNFDLATCKSAPEICFSTTPLYIVMPTAVGSPDLKDTSNIDFLTGDTISNVYVTAKVRPCSGIFLMFLVLRYIAYKE